MRRSATILCLALLYFPLGWLLYCSVSVLPSGGGERAFTLSLFKNLFADLSLLQPLIRSFWVALWAALLSGVIGTLLAVGCERGKFVGKKLLVSVVMIPVAIPEIVLGIALLGWFAVLKLQFGILTLVIAHVTFSTGYVFATVLARMKGFDSRLEEAAADLGASPRQIFWRVTFPVIFPGILSGIFLAFVLSFDDFLISFFVTGSGYDTLPIKLYGMMKFGLNPTVYPLAAILLFATAAGTIVGVMPSLKRK